MARILEIIISSAIFPDCVRSCIYFSLAFTSRLFHIRNTAGIIIRVRRVALTMPPTIGAAIRRMTSDPVPVPSMIGSRPAMIAATVIITGRTLNNAPLTTACFQVFKCRLSLALYFHLLPCLVQIDQHNNADLYCNTCQCNKSNTDRY